MKKSCKFLGVFLSLSLLCSGVVNTFAASLDENTSSFTVPVDYSVSCHYEVTIPNTVSAIAEGDDGEGYPVTARNVVLEADTQLSVSCTYSGQLKNISDDDITLNYEVQSNGSPCVSGDSCLTVKAGTVGESVSDLKVFVVQEPMVSGLYEDTMLFTLVVEPDTES